MDIKKGKGKNKIFDYIATEWVYERDLNKVHDVLVNLETLVENQLATKISASEYVTPIKASRFNIVCEWLISKDKSLNKNVVKSAFNYREYADDNKEATELAKARLNVGVYGVDLKKDNFAVLIVQNPDEYETDDIQWQLYFIGNKNLKYRNKMLSKFEKLTEMNQTTSNTIYYMNGMPSKNIKFKTFDKLVLRDGENILSYINNWRRNIPAYYERGINAKLSILLYGKPGTGKSSFAQALANHIGMRGIVSISPDYFFGTDDGRINHIADTMYVIDEIDCVCNSRENDNSKENKQALSKLLDFLDNPPSSYIKADDGKYYDVSIVVATTNYIKRLDEAVKRYGRFDRQIELKEFNKEEAQKLCDIFGVDYSIIPGDINSPKFSISPAQLQALCIENIDSSFKNKQE